MKAGRICISRFVKIFILISAVYYLKRLIVISFDESVAHTTQYVKKLVPGHTQSKIILVHAIDEKFWKKSEKTIKAQKKFNNCLVTFDKSKAYDADFIIFRSLTPSFYYNEYKKFRPIYQQWVFFETEAPFYGNQVETIEGLHNLTITYKRSSDITLPYGTYRKRNTFENFSKNVLVDLWKQKIYDALWLVSNCKPIIRKRFASQLSKYINLHIGGACAEDFQSIGAKKVKIISKSEISKYKFYLAFENSFCDEYISDKYWINAIAHGSVPVVLGGANYSELAIPGSFINANQFHDIESLGNYLKKVGSDEQFYLKYLEWTSSYEYVKTSDEGWPHMSNWLCVLCEIVNNGTYPYKVYNISAYWNSNTDCHGKDHHAKMMLFREAFKKSKLNKDPIA